MQFLFTGGSQRSGTTLLQKFLCMDSATTPKLAEASYLRMMMQAYAQGKEDFDHDTKSYFSNLDDFRHYNAGIIYSFLNRTLAQFPQASSLVLKEPHLTPLFPQLFELVPDARFIITMRDPRDIMASMIEVGIRMQQQGQQHFFQQRDIKYLSDYIKTFYAPTLNNQDQTFRDRCLVIRYEDLVKNTADTKKALSSFTGLAMDFDENSKLNPNAHKDEDNNQPRYQPWITDNNSKDINPSSIGHYQSVLTDAEIELANKHCADILQLFQYS